MANFSRYMPFSFIVLLLIAACATDPIPSPSPMVTATPVPYSVAALTPTPLPTLVIEQTALNGNGTPSGPTPTSVEAPVIVNGRETTFGEFFDTLTLTQKDCVNTQYAGPPLEELMESPVGGDGDADAIWEFLTALAECAPEVLGEDSEDSAASGIPHDFANATQVKIGQAVPAAIDHGHDWDHFVFFASEGQLYLIGTTLGTLHDSKLEVFNSLYEPLVSADDYGPDLAAHLYWQAPSTGEYYVGVGGYGEGDYTFSVTVSDVEDDHINNIVGATAVQPGKDAPGKINYSGDVDFFRLQTTESTIYRIEAALGTLENCVLELYDADGEVWASNEFYPMDGMAIRLGWQAPDASSWYIAVSGHHGGSYSLSVEEVKDAHGDSREDATPLTIGEPAEGEIEHEIDLDYFMFEATEGSFYRIDANPGTLQDPVLELLDKRSTILTNDDYGDSLAARLYWQSDESGLFWVVVRGHGTGTYELVVSGDSN